MHHIKHIYLYLLGALLISSCAAKSADHEDKELAPLKGNEIRSIISGSKIQLIGYDDEAVLTFYQNGRIKAENVGNERNDGIWKINNEDNLCLRFKRWGGGNNLCYSLYEQDGEYKLSRKGRKHYNLTIIEKNTAAPLVTKRKISSQENIVEEVVESIPLKEKTPEIISKQAKEDLSYVVRNLAKDCPGCNLREANLAGADLSNADLQGANLAGANMRYTNLRRANLKGANLYNADLTGANLKGANLEGANLQGAEGLP